MGLRAQVAGRETEASFSPSAAGDRTALRSCWHPVLFSDALGEAPVPADLLGERLALWRDSEGKAHAVSDTCIHRGAPLSLGRVDGDEIVCPYHGWRYGTSGVCTAIPQLADPTRVPAKARIASYRCVERYEIVWVALDEPRWPLPEAPEFESPYWRVVTVGPYTWHADASRQLENFTDFGHFAWVHEGLLGDPSHPVIPQHTVHTDDHVLHYDYELETPVPSELPAGTVPNAEDGMMRGRTRYRLFLPYTIVQKTDWYGPEESIVLFASQPNGPDMCTGYFVGARNYNLERADEADRALRDMEDTIFGQDQRIVEAQRPERVPFDLADELHLKFDAVAVAYRKAMRQQGLASA